MLEDLADLMFNSPGLVVRGEQTASIPQEEMVVQALELNLFMAVLFIMVGVVEATFG
jgi:hypothetical protein